MYAIEYRWMSADTPVTKRHIVTDSGSIKTATFTWYDPMGSQLKRVSVISRLLCPSRPIQVTTARTKAMPIAAVATQPATGSPSLRPNATRTTKPPRAHASIQGAA